MKGEKTYLINEPDWTGNDWKPVKGFSEEEAVDNYWLGRFWSDPGEEWFGKELSCLIKKDEDSIALRYTTRLKEDVYATSKEDK